MGLILCDNVQVNRPLYFEGLGVQINSLEELCYVIYNYPLYVIHGFVNERLFSFLKYDLGLGLNALLLERRAKDISSDGDILVAILNFSDYYSTQEIEKFKTRISELYDLPRYELYNRIGIEYFSQSSYGKALNNFNESLKNASGQKIDPNVISIIKMHKADAYANLFDFDNAFDLYKEIFESNNDINVLKKIYFLSKFDNNVSNREKYINYLDDRVNEKWDIEYQKVLDKASQCEESTMFQQEMKVDSYKRKSLINERIKNIKRKYRNMI